MGRPCQWLLFAKPNHGVTAEYLVKLTHNWYNIEYYDKKLSAIWVEIDWYWV
jgi:hypothetical protein